MHTAGLMTSGNLQALHFWGAVAVADTYTGCDTCCSLDERHLLAYLFYHDGMPQDAHLRISFYQLLVFTRFYLQLSGTK